MSAPCPTHRSVAVPCPTKCADGPGHIHWRCIEGCSDPREEPAVEVKPRSPNAPIRMGSLHGTAAPAALRDCGHAECTDFCHRRYSGEILTYR